MNDLYLPFIVGSLALVVIVAMLAIAHSVSSRMETWDDEEDEK